MLLINKIKDSLIINLTIRLVDCFLILYICNLFLSCSRDLEDINTPEAKKLNSPQSLNVVFSRDGTIQLNWIKSTDNILGYRIYQSIHYTDNFSSIAVTNETYFIIKNLSYDTIYFYKITAYNENSESDFSNIVNGKPVNVNPPQMPFGLVVYGSNYEDKRRMLLSWYPNSEGDLSKYIVYRKVEINSLVSEYEKIDETPMNIYMDTNKLLAGYKYYYKIAAVDRANSISPLSYEESDYILEKPGLISPRNQELLSSNLLFKWEKVNNTTGYVYILSDSPNSNEIWSSTIKSDNEQGLQIILSLSLLETGKMYFWKVATFSKSTDHLNSFSEIRSFYYYPQFLLKL